MFLSELAIFSWFWFFFLDFNFNGLDYIYCQKND